MLAVAGVVGLFALVGIFGHMAETLAAGLASETGRDTVAAAAANQGAILWGGLTSAVALALAALCVGLPAIPARTATIGLAVIVSGDLWLNARPFWDYVAPYGRDAVIDQLTTTQPSRVLNIDAYPGSALMAFDVPQVLGYHGNELATYDALLGGKNEWRNLNQLRLWGLLGVSHVILPATMQMDSIPEFHKVLETEISTGARVRLFERVGPTTYVRVVPAAAKANPEQIVPTLLDPRMDYSRIVLLTPDAPIDPPPLTALPPPSATQAHMQAWSPGRMTITLDPPPRAPSYVLIAENWFPDWRAWTDGKPALVLRGDYTLLTVAVPAGTQEVVLGFRSEAFAHGRLLTLCSALLLIGLAVGSRFQNPNA
jgi:hypothetical protein